MVVASWDECFNAGAYGVDGPQFTLCLQVADREAIEKQITKFTLASPRPSSSQSPNQGRRLSDGAKSATTTTSSSSNSSSRKKVSGILRASSGNILQLAQMGSLKQLAYKSPEARHLPSIRAPKSLESNVTMGNILRRNSDERKLQEPMNKLDTEELKLMGNNKYKQGRYEEAVALYDQTIAIDSNSAAHRNNKSAALTELGRILEAVSECREAVRIDPHYQRARHLLGTLYFRLGHAEETLEQFNLSGGITNFQDITQAKALQACFSMCTEAENLNDWATVLKQTHDAIAIGANSSLQIYALQAQALLNLHKHDEADMTFKRRPNFDMDSYTHLFGKARSCYLFLIEAKVYMATGRLVDFISRFLSITRYDPDIGNLDDHYDSLSVNFSHCFFQNP